MIHHFSMPLFYFQSAPLGAGDRACPVVGVLSSNAGCLRYCHRQAGHPCPTPLPVTKIFGLAIRIRFPPTRWRLNEAPSG